MEFTVSPIVLTAGYGMSVVSCIGTKLRSTKDVGYFRETTVAPSEHVIPHETNCAPAPSLTVLDVETVK